MGTGVVASGIENEGGADPVTAGPGNRQPGAVLQVVSRARLRKRPRTAQSFTVERCLKVVIRLVAKASGDPQLAGNVVIQLGVDLVQVIYRRPVRVVLVHHRRAPNVGLRDVWNDLQS